MKTSTASVIVFMFFCILSVPGVHGAGVWEKMELAEPYNTLPFYDVWGTSDQDLYCVGFKYLEGSQYKGLIYHYNGKVWTEIPSGNSACLYRIWASSESDIFIVGQHKNSSGIVRHYDGSAWSDTVLGNTFYALWGTSSSNVYAADIGGQIFHYDGSDWTRMTTPTDNNYAYQQVWGSSESDVFAVGFYTPTGEDERYAIVHYDGSKWSVLKTGAGGRLMNVWGSSASNVYAVGYPGILHYNGAKWSVMKDSASLGASVYSIWGSSSSNVFVGRTDGRIMHYDGTEWTVMETGINTTLWNIWGLSAASVYAAGSYGTILHYSSNEPRPPSNLSARASSSTQIVLGWKDNSTNETGFKIEQKTGNCSSSAKWKLISDKAANTTTHIASGLTPNTVYAFRVKAYNSSEDSDFSNCIYGKTGPSGSPPSPANLTAVSVSPTAVQLRWKDKSANEDGFKIFRKKDAGDWSLMKTIGKNKVAYRDESAFQNQSPSAYQYYVCAYKSSKHSPSTQTAIVVYQPTKLTAAPGSSSGKVTVKWTDNSSNESGFEIYRKSGSCSSSEPWISAGKVGGSRTSWIDTGKKPGDIYSYRIRAFKKSGGVLPAYGYSMWSNCDEAVVP